jgi:hypothetical protein
LAQSPEQAEARVTDYALEIKDKQVHARGLVHLAQHSLTHQKTTYKQQLQDLPGAIGFLQPSVLAATSDMLSMIPEIVPIGAQISSSRAFHEYREGFVRLFSVEEGSPRQRRLVFESLLHLLRREMTSPAGNASTLTPKQVARLLECVIDLPLLGTAEKTVRSQWHILLGPLMATVVRLSEHIGRRPLKMAQKRFAKKWTWLSHEQWKPVALWFDPEIRASYDSGFELAHDWSRMEPLLYPRLADRDEHLVAWLSRMPAGEERDSLCWILMRYGWLDAEQWQATLGLLWDPELRSEALLWQTPAPPVATWLDTLAVAVKLDFDPFRTENWPLLRKLWTLGKELDKEKSPEFIRLAECVQTMLSSGGTRKVEVMLQLWLNLFLAPEPGVIREELQAHNAIDAAISRAGKLVNPNQVAPEKL